jgi:hypothetical protein
MQWMPYKPNAGHIPVHQQGQDCCTGVSNGNHAQASVCDQSYPLCKHVCISITSRQLATSYMCPGNGWPITTYNGSLFKKVSTYMHACHDTSKVHNITLLVVGLQVTIPMSHLRPFPNQCIFEPLSPQGSWDLMRKHYALRIMLCSSCGARSGLASTHHVHKFHCLSVVCMHTELLTFSHRPSLQACISAFCAMLMVSSMWLLVLLYM